MSILREEYPHILTLSLMLGNIALTDGIWSPGVLLVCIVLVTTMWVFPKLRTIQSTKWKFRIAFVYYQTIQSYILCRNFFGSSIYTMDMFASVVIMMQHELTPLHGAVGNSLIILKNTVLWAFLFRKVNSDQVVDLNFMVAAFWSFFHLFNYLAVRKESLVSSADSVLSLQKERERLEALLQAVPDGVVVVTERKEVVRYNTFLLKQLSIQKDCDNIKNAIIKSFSEMKYLPEYAEIESSSGDLLTDILSFMQRKNKEADSIGVVNFAGGDYELRGRCCTWDETTACIIIIRDITYWVNLEKKAKRESASKTALLRSVSHELRTPTNVILNLAREIMEHEPLSTVGVTSIQMMTSSTYFLISIINDLLDYSRIITGNFKLTIQGFQLEPVIKECIMLIQHQCKNKGVELKLFYDSLLPKTVYTDQNRLKQVLLNLLSNAVK